MATKYSMHPPKKYLRKGLKEDHFLRIDSGTYKGTEFVFGDVSFRGQREDGRALISFTYDVFKCNKKRVKKQSFESVLKDILDQIMMKMADDPSENLELPIDTSPTEFSPHEIID
jgi:hypothetical protein